MAEDKTFAPFTTITLLGYELNSVRMEISEVSCASHDMVDNQGLEQKELTTHDPVQYADNQGLEKKERTTHDLFSMQTIKAWNRKN
ncbi:hypothetical protein CHS0354_033667 [Potamilus streckersoni]|uniref:Uncharacterized protein n=1 Tax=Potamilus streckersoni TaxID=2493646 RepID=A0AAE0VNA2_9BIVA|nr:hypothetical protein CHS0354_033667 [Potamilus streckersoni]